MRVRIGSARGAGFAACLLLALAASGIAAMAQDQASSSDDTVGLTVDFGNGVEKTFGALPHSDGMRVMEALQAAGNQPPGLDMEFWFDRADSTGIGKIDGVGGFPVTEDPRWLIFIDDRPAGGTVVPGRFLSEAQQREINEKLTVAAGETVLIQRGEAPPSDELQASGDAPEPGPEEMFRAGSIGKTVGMWRITLGEGVDAAAFEEAWASATGLDVGVGQQTRGGIVTASYLLQSEPLSASPDEYVWMVHWIRQGGSPLGSADAPRDPKEVLEGVDIETSFVKYELVEQLR